MTQQTKETLKRGGFGAKKVLVDINEYEFLKAHYEGKSATIEAIADKLSNHMDADEDNMSAIASSLKTLSETNTKHEKFIDRIITGYFIAKWIVAVAASIIVALVYFKDNLIFVFQHSK